MRDFMRLAELAMRDNRALRVKNKAVENAGKKPLRSPDVLEAADFTFAPFSQERGDGDSGTLLLATHKQDASRKYLIKHAFCDCAANEYVYSKMAQAMGLRMPDVKLFRLEDPLDGSLFRTEYVAGIEFLNIAAETSGNPSGEMLLSAKNPDDYYRFCTLYELFRESDSVQVVLADDGYIYRIDATDAFALSEMQLSTAGIENHLYEDHLAWRWQLTELDHTMRALIEWHGEDKAGVLLDPLYTLQNVHKPYINSFLNTLCYFYPDAVDLYYSHFFELLKKSVKRFTTAIEKY